MRGGRSVARPLCLGLLLGLGTAAGSYPTTATAAQLTLHWDDNSYNESGFRIRREIYGLGPMSRVATVGQNITSYTDTGLMPGVIYCYRVKAFNTTDKSIVSNKACGMAK